MLFSNSYRELMLSVKFLYRLNGLTEIYPLYLKSLNLSRISFRLGWESNVFSHLTPRLFNVFNGFLYVVEFLSRLRSWI